MPGCLQLVTFPARSKDYMKDDIIVDVLNLINKAAGVFEYVTFKIGFIRTNLSLL